ncbi:MULTISPECIES: cobalamin biosynthesis protein [unclassified Mesorhizobium]|uniref:cobalamin biosynthesis protein n=1 Tax=unclassified Mesorhizobium TaxID=325217 RepID=UPI000FDB1BD7|nr:MULTISPECIES: cobalamin biosynthesis protein [unclassified Mesorhizobium]TGQ39795.1 cobalamin biosynthesis protein [Mesorhizobium sp. M00.F.Ca.ET.216.01.1.1]TIS57848.1 MAG: cobalamin biosynthesis protein [Mesorhizobium sp.]TIS90411.1 MAG: cobalamin biosynthesis protein [Mesorhizobium sp.]TJW13362.1 MAG: cobalamin biosynthesis protein [Mesorhizobium sp.]TJW43067.1 MAG: cobalamin biosynthesis protein [Mesorhizobium sp.]
MMVAGIGSRKGISARDVLAAVETALETHGLAVTALSALATASLKRDEDAIFSAGRELALPVIVVEGEALKSASPGTISRSDLSQEHAGSPSVSEASALAAAGRGAKLLGPRTVLGPVTCAIAISGDAA